MDSEELLVHIKGIKFHNPGFGVGRITKELEKIYDEKVSENRVRKLMKKNGLTETQLEADNKAAGVLHMFTVGDSDKPHSSLYNEPCVENEDQVEFVPIELNVPGNRSGSAKYQGTISHVKNNNASNSISDKGNVFKIQTTVGAIESDELPMLMYNQPRSQQTYIHSNALGYKTIKTLVLTNGLPGVTGTDGGLKAYFYGKLSREYGRNTIVINVMELAPLDTPW